MRAITVGQTRIALLQFAAVAVILALAACTSNFKSQIVGQWKVKSDTSALVWEFAENGTVTSGDMRGRYTLGAQNLLKIQTPFATFVYEVELSGDSMKWKSSKGSTTELARVK